MARLQPRPVKRAYLMGRAAGYAGKPLAHGARVTSGRAGGLQVQRCSSSVGGRCSRPPPSSSHCFPGPTSPVDCGGDEDLSPCQGSGLPYHLRHGSQGGRSLLVPPGGGTRAPLQSAERYGILATLGIPRGIPRVAKIPKQGILVVFIHCPRDTRRQLRLTRRNCLLPYPRTASKVDVLRRTSGPQAWGPDVHRRPCSTRHRAKARYLSKSCRHPAHLTWCGPVSHCLTEARGPQPRARSRQGSRALPGKVAGLLPPVRPSTAAQYVKDVPCSVGTRRRCLVSD